MNYKIIVTWIILVCPYYLFAQQNKYDCEEIFKWVKETFEKNDAGFDYGLQQKGKEAYEKHNNSILQKIKKTVKIQIHFDQSVSLQKKKILQDS